MWKSNDDGTTFVCVTCIDAVDNEPPFWWTFNTYAVIDKEQELEQTDILYDTDDFMAACMYEDEVCHLTVLIRN